MLKKSLFTLDSGDDKPAILEGYTDGQTWNGFACPMATRESIIRFMEVDSYAKTWKWQGENLLDCNGGEYEPESEFEPIVYTPSMIDGLKLYGLGFGLCWYEAEHLSYDTAYIIEALNQIGFYAMVLTDGRFRKGVEGVSQESTRCAESWKESIKINIPLWIQNDYDVIYQLDQLTPTITILQK